MPSPTEYKTVQARILGYMEQYRPAQRLKITLLPK